MNRFVKAICYFKYFVPPGTIIEPRSTCTTKDELELWMTQITKLSNIVQANVLQFVKHKKALAEQSAAPVMGPVKKKRNIEVYPCFESMYKYLNTKVPVCEYDALLPTGVHDRATTAAGHPVIRYDRVRAFRSK